MRLYGEIIVELYGGGDYPPYMRKKHVLSHLSHDIQCRPCILRSVSWVSVDCGTR